jgi:hypothetical protein
VADFRRPAAPGDGDEVRHGRGPARRCPAQVKGELVRAGDQAADEQVLAFDGGGGHCPVAVAGAFGPVPAGPAFEHGILDGLISPDRGAGRHRDLVVARDNRHVRQPGPGCFLAQLLAAAIHLIECGPPGRQPGRGQPAQLSHRELRLGGEFQGIGDPGGAAPGKIPCPAVRHVYIEVRPRLAARGDIGGEHRGHAILHLPGAPGMLRRYARGGVPVLELGGLIDRDARADQVTVGIRDPRHRQRGQLRTQLRPVPPVGAEQRLHPAPPLMTSRFRQDPAVRLDPRRQRRHVIKRHAGTTPLRHHPLQDTSDLGICSRRAISHVLYAGHRGRVVVVVFHKPPTRHGRPGSHCFNPAASAPSDGHSP